MTNEQKTKRIGSAQDFHTQYDEEGGAFLDRIVTGDETGVSYVSTLSKNDYQWCGVTPQRRENPSNIGHC